MVMYQLLTTVSSKRVTAGKNKTPHDENHMRCAKYKTLNESEIILTKAAENVVEVIEIIIAFFQHGFVPNSFVDLLVGLCYCAGAVRGQTK